MQYYSEYFIYGTIYVLFWQWYIVKFLNWYHAALISWMHMHATIIKKSLRLINQHQQCIVFWVIEENLVWFYVPRTAPFCELPCPCKNTTIIVWILPKRTNQLQDTRYIVKKKYLLLKDVSNTLVCALVDIAAWTTIKLNVKMSIQHLKIWKKNLSTWQLPVYIHLTRSLTE